MGNDKNNDEPFLDRALEAIRAELRRQLLRDKVHHLDLELGAKVQGTLLPKQLHHEKIDVDVVYRPFEEIGGDYCQVRIADEKTCYITMCDVTGHGVAAGLLATRVSSEVRHWIMERLAPKDIVELLNTFILDHFGDTGLYLSFIAAQIDLDRGRITWSSAGHPSPLLIRNNGKTVERLNSQNAWIGINSTILTTEPEHDLPLEKGDRLVFHTDGLTESLDREGRLLGIEGLERVALVAACMDLFEMADKILNDIARDFDGPITDDKTLIVAEIK